MRMELGLSQHQALKQIQTLSPQMYLSMEILCMNSLDLEERVETEIQSNETLELVEPTLSPEAEAERRKALEEDRGKSEESFDERFERWDQYSREELGSGRSASSYRGERDEKLEALNNTESRPLSLQDHLESQMHLLEDSLIQETAERYLDEFAEPTAPVAREGKRRSAAARKAARAARVEEAPRRFAIAAAAYFEDEALAARPALLASMAPADGERPGADPGVSPEASSGSAAASEDVESGASQVGASDAADAARDGSREPSGPLRPEGLRRVRQLCDDVIFNIDERGYVMFGADEIAASLEEPAPVELVELAVRVVQSLEPAGVGGRGLAECLLLQLERDPQDYPVEERIIREHLDDLGHNRLPKIARALGMSIEEVKDAVENIASLNPLPGKLFGGELPRYVKPDVMVDEIDGQYRVRVDSTFLPRVQVSPHYRNLYRESRKDPDIKKYLKRKMDSAEWLIAAIRQRQSTLQRIAQEIIDIQFGFLDNGISDLKPLKMAEVAERIGVHVSTVSRAISGKYVQTPRGIYDLKFFFTGGATKADGNVEARGSVIQRIKDLIAEEDKSKPLSDVAIVEELEKSGIQISRRTVTKYREAESIPSSRERREY